MITLRFVTGDNLVSRLIRMQAGVSMPFTPSHVETLSPDGKFYIGAHFDGGVAARPIGYDHDQMVLLPDGSRSERLIDLPASNAQVAAFHAFVRSKLGEPYDSKAIVGFVEPDAHQHELDHVICSAFMTAALRACDYFPSPLTVPFHHISPRDLFLILSTHIQIDH
jgi:hypothetical protein